VISDPSSESENDKDDWDKENESLRDNDIVNNVVNNYDKDDVDIFDNDIKVEVDGDANKKTTSKY
jgi:hypothetical protein